MQSSEVDRPGAVELLDPPREPLAVAVAGGSVDPERVVLVSEDRESFILCPFSAIAASRRIPNFSPFFGSQLFAVFFARRRYGGGARAR